MTSEQTLDRITRLENDVSDILGQAKAMAEAMEEAVTTAQECEERNRRAARQLSELLAMPDNRPGSWEAEPVEALEVDYLAPILDALTGAEQEVRA